MSELDFNQKLEMRRAFWATGASTRVDVKLGAMVDPAKSRTRASAEDWTDLDVLGVQYSALTGVTFAVADCKTAKARVTERVFWLRGVADLFGAEAAFLTRDGSIPESARQLALRLRIAAMDAADRAAFVEQAGESQLPMAGRFLEADTLRRWMKLTLETPDAIARLQRYRQSYYWLVPRRRNLTALPTAVATAARAFDTDQRWARALLVDMAWLYLVAILTALEEMTRLHLAEPRMGLTQAVVGTEQDRREKEALARQLAELFTRIDPSVASRLPRVPVLPDYFEELVDLVARVARRRGEINGALRVLEFTGVETIARSGAPWSEAFPTSNPRESKLASDVLRFLVRATGVSPDFVTIFDNATVPAPSESMKVSEPSPAGEPTKASEPSPASEPTKVSEPSPPSQPTAASETGPGPVQSEQPSLFEESTPAKPDSAGPAVDRRRSIDSA